MASGNVALAGAATGPAWRPRDANEAGKSGANQADQHSDQASPRADRDYGPLIVAAESTHVLTATCNESTVIGVNMNQIVPDRIGVMDVSTPVSSVDKARHGSGTGDAGVLCHGSLQPLHDRVLVRRIEGPRASPIIVPDIAKTPPLKGVVVAVGPGKKGSDGVFRETMVRPGDVVMFTASVDVPYADLVHDGDLVMMAEADILGIVGIG